MSDIVDVDLALTPFVARQTSTRNPSPTTPSASSSQTLFDYAPWKKQRRLGESRGEKNDILLHELVASGARIHGVHTRSVPYSKDQGIRARQGLMGHLALLGSRCKQRCVHVAAAERRELQGVID
jgi:hypothetical protein